MSTIDRKVREAHDSHCEADVCHCGYTHAQHEGYGCGCPGFVAISRECADRRTATMSDLRIAITGSRRVTAADAARVERIVEALTYDVRPREIIFGGAAGVDTLALVAAQHNVSHRGGTVRAHRTRLVVIVPDVVAAQPHEARDAIRRYADEVIELGRRITSENGWRAYHTRNAAMVDRATAVLGFWDGNARTGTGSCLAYAARIGRPLWIEAIGDARACGPTAEGR